MGVTTPTRPTRDWRDTSRVGPVYVMSCNVVSSCPIVIVSVAGLAALSQPQRQTELEGSQRRPRYSALLVRFNGAQSTWAYAGPLNALGEDIMALSLVPDIKDTAGGGCSEAQTDIFDQNLCPGPMLGTDINGPSRAGPKHKRS